MVIFLAPQVHSHSQSSYNSLSKQQEKDIENSVRGIFISAGASPGMGLLSTSSSFSASSSFSSSYGNRFEEKVPKPQIFTMVAPDPFATSFPEYDLTQNSTKKTLDWISENTTNVFIGLGIAYAVLLVFWLASAFHYRKTYKKNCRNWRKLSQFPIIKYGYTKIAKFYTVVMISMGILSVLHPFYSYSLIVGFSVYGSTFICACSFYSTFLSGQVYQVLLAMSVVEDCLASKDEEPLTEYEIGKKQIEKKIWIRHLYKTFLVRDFIVLPILIFIDKTRPTTQESNFYFTEVYVTIFHIAIFALVPLTGAFYVYSITFKPYRTLNSLQSQIVYQMASIMAIQYTLLMCFIVLGFMFGYSFGLLHIFQLITLILPIIIQITTWIEGNGKSTNERVEIEVYSIGP